MRKLSVSRTGYVWDDVYVRVKSHIDIVTRKAVYRKERRQLEFKIYSAEMRKLWEMYARKYIEGLMPESKVKIVREYRESLYDFISKKERANGAKPECRLTETQILFCYYTKTIWPAFEEDIRLKLFRGKNSININTKGIFYETEDDAA